MTQAEKIKWKEEVKSICIQLIKARVQTATDAMEQAQEAANSEEKSSAGDKYETGRAMSQRERDMNAMQLKEAKLELILLHSIVVDKIYKQVESGSVIKTKDKTYFIATGLGSIKVNEEKIYILSPKAPLALQSIGKRIGEIFQFNGNESEILEIF
jgi:hypothetical protein